MSICQGKSRAGSKHRITVMRKKILVSALILSFLLNGCNYSSAKQPSSNSGISRQVKAIDKTNWNNNPQILEIHNIKEEIEALIKTGKLEKSEKRIEYSGPQIPVSKVLFIDQNQAVRKYIQDTGSDDSALTSSYYYDPQGRLRFAFIKGGAVNGSELEHRVYFNTEGKRIWEMHQYIKGPGYTFPEKWPDDMIITNPKEAFDR